MGKAVDRGDVELLWQPQRENVLDELAHRLIGAVRRRKVKRLFIDGLGGFLESATSPQRVSRFLLLPDERAARPGGHHHFHDGSARDHRPRVQGSLIRACRPCWKTWCSCASWSAARS